VAEIEDSAREAVQDVVETVVTRFQRDPADVEQFIPVEMELGLRLKADVITFVFYDTFEYYLSSSISTYLYTICPCCV
jgi:hypothetical protein